MTSSSKVRYKSLDAWRGVAALSVIVFHIGYDAMKELEADPALSDFKRALARIIMHMDLGVILFFVISGYCIAASADLLRTSKERGPLIFFKRRLRRIYPTYWASLVFVCLADLVLLLTLQDSFGPGSTLLNITWNQFLGNLFLVETWRPLIIGGPERLILNPAWSLCYEEQFYLIVGLLLFTKKRFFIWLTAISLLVLGAHLYQYHTAGFLFRRLFLDGSWLYFGVGLYVYYALRHQAEKAMHWRAGLLVLTVLVWLYAWMFKSEFAMFLSVACAYGAILMILYNDDQTLSQTRLIRPLMRCGRISFSLYLVHLPVCELLKHTVLASVLKSYWGVVLVATPIAMAASVLVATMFYLVVESRFTSSPVDPYQKSPLMP